MLIAYVSYSSLTSKARSSPITVRITSSLQFIKTLSQRGTLTYRSAAIFYALVLYHCGTARWGHKPNSLTYLHHSTTITQENYRSCRLEPVAERLDSRAKELKVHRSGPAQNERKRNRFNKPFPKSSRRVQEFKFPKISTT